MRELPETRYAKSGDIHIAYQVLGDGAVDLVLVPNWGINVEALWNVPALALVCQRLTSIGRLILLDSRGSGGSDPLPSGEVGTFEHAAEDLLAVMNAVGAQRVFLIGSDASAAVECLFAATHPERTAGIVLVGAFASLIDRGDGIGFPPETRDMVVDFVASRWGDPDNVSIRIAVPGADRENDRRTVARIQRLAMSPITARSLAAMTIDADVRGILGSIQAPTLVLHRAGDQLVAPEHGRYLAAHITGSRYVELPGDDHWMFFGDVDLAMEEIHEFVTGVRPSPEPERVLVTILFTDIVRSTERAAKLGDRKWRELLTGHNDLVRRQLERFRGREIKSTGDGILATFDGPGRAINCARAIREGARILGVDVRAGLHTGEVEVMGADVGGIAVHIAARVMARAGPGEVIVASSVPPLVAGSGIEFEDRGEHELRGVPGRWQLFSVEGQPPS